MTPRGSGSEFSRAESYGNEIAGIALASIAAGQAEVSGPIAINAQTTYYNYVVTNPLFIIADALGILGTGLFPCAPRPAAAPPRACAEWFCAPVCSCRL